MFSCHKRPKARCEFMIGTLGLTWWQWHRSVIWEVEQGRGVGSLARGQFERQVDTMGAGNGVSRLLGMLSWITNFLGCMLLEGGKCFAVKMHFGQTKDLGSICLEA